MSVDAGTRSRESPPELASLASFRASLEQSDALERSYRFHGFLQTLSPDEVAEASQILEASSPWLVEDELLNFMIAWARFGGPEALEWARTRRGPFREPASAAALEGWAFHDPVAARRALESVDPPSERDGLEEFFVAGWLKGGNHDGVMEFIMAQPPGNERQRYTNLLTIELMREGFDAVAHWADAIPDDAPGSYKRMAFQKAANILATVDPVRTARWIEPHLGHAYAELAPTVMGRRWQELDPPAALDWLAGLPRSEAHDDALKASLLMWLREAPADANDWARATSEAGRGNAVIAVMITQYPNDPARALSWAWLISDRPDRFQTIVRLTRAWHRSDPEAAERWLEQSDFTPRVRSVILNPPTPRLPGSRGEAPGGRGAAPVADDAGAGPAS